MKKILFLTTTENDGSLSKYSLEVLGAVSGIAKALPAALSVGLIGKSTSNAAQQIALCGAEKFYSVEGDDYGISRFSTDSAAAEALAKAAQAEIILAPANLRLSRALPALSVRLNGRIDSRVCAVKSENGSLEIQRPYYRQRMQAIITRAQTPWLLLLESGCFQAYQGASGQVSVEKITPAVSYPLTRTTVEGTQAASSGTQTIRPDAELLFVAGAGWTKKQADGKTHVKDAENLILSFLEQTRASLGSSKSLVDQSGEGQEVITFLTHLNQIGQTGTTPRHTKGLSTCCHGEEPHVVGWRFINERRAINTDPNCGWAQGKADVLYVADAFAVMKKVNELLGK